MTTSKRPYYNAVWEVASSVGSIPVFRQMLADNSQVHELGRLWLQEPIDKTPYRPFAQLSIQSTDSR